MASMGVPANMPSSTWAEQDCFRNWKHELRPWSFFLQYHHGSGSPTFVSYFASLLLGFRPEGLFLSGGTAEPSAVVVQMLPAPSLGTGCCRQESHASPDQGCKETWLIWPHQGQEKVGADEAAVYHAPHQLHGGLGEFVKALADSVSFLAAMVFSLTAWGRVLCCCAEPDPSTHHGHTMFVMLQLEKYNSFRHGKRW